MSSRASGASIRRPKAVIAKAVATWPAAASEPQDRPGGAAAATVTGAAGRRPTLSMIVVVIVIVIADRAPDRAQRLRSKRKTSPSVAQSLILGKGLYALGSVPLD